MDEALLRSFLQMDALADEKLIGPGDAEGITGLEDNPDPDLSLQDSVMLIRRTGWDSHLLVLLGLEGTDSGLNTDLEGSPSDELALAQLHDHSQDECEGGTDQDSGSGVKHQEGNKDQELRPASEVQQKHLHLWSRDALETHLFK